MKQQFYFLLTILLGWASMASAQIYDIDELRYKPDSNSLRVERPELDIRPVTLPISALDLRVIYWRHWSSFGINANQASFSDNWNGGGVNSISVGLLLNHKSDYTRNNTNFVTELILQYGKQKNRDQLPRKNNDRIYWDNKLSQKISKSWSIYTSLTFDSQFDIGNSFGKDISGRDSITGVISNFMAPGRLTESLGIEYKPDNTFSLRFGTGTARQTFVLDRRIDPTRYGVEEGKRVKNDLAFQLTANLNRNLSPNLNLTSKYNLFADYEKLNDPSHRLDATLTARVTRLVNVTLSGTVLYDSDYIEEGKTKSEVQYSQALSLGLLFKLPK
ncbi:DUF3078 domain-containing protein [Parapedobacter soli]|uniref:DUF3078 domain-containing protein n=1 Tax=Parapedobacter soli TaxID=416955 RepID=UPI0021C6C4DD|nr:DUF3078 domain-containing protein [Parapedobacter soli]